MKTYRRSEGLGKTLVQAGSGQGRSCGVVVVGGEGEGLVVAGVGGRLKRGVAGLVAPGGVRMPGLMASGSKPKSRLARKSTPRSVVNGARGAVPSGSWLSRDRSMPSSSASKSMSESKPSRKGSTGLGVNAAGKLVPTGE